MSGSNDSGKTSPLFDPAFAVILLGLAFIGLCWAAWHYHHAEITWLMFWIKYPQVWLLSQFSDKYDYHLAFIQGVRPGDVTASQLWALMSDVGRIFAWPIIALLVAMAGWCMLKPIERRFRRRLNIDTLMADLAHVFPTILPAVVENPQTDTTGRWARALKAKEWVAKRKVVCDATGRPDTESMREALASDLGVPWRGFKALPPHLRALIAAFALSYGRRRDDYTRLTNALAQLWGKGGWKIGMDAALKKNKRIIDYCDKVLEHPKFGGAVEVVALRHAYVLSALIALVEYARKDRGVVACAEFKWLRVENRSAWYALQNAGRPTSFVEGAAAKAQWHAEVQVGRPLYDPALDEAVRALVEKLGFDPDAYEPDLDGFLADN